MSVLAPPSFTSLPRNPVAPVPHRITVAQFHELHDRGFYGQRRLMLIDGIVLEKEVMNAPHINACDLMGAALRGAFGPGWIVREDKPIFFGLYSDPHPDFQVLKGTVQDYPEVPTSASLIVEISDSSLSYDTREKLELYARAGIQEYWVLDLNRLRLLVYRDPVGKDYTSQQELDSTKSISPLAKPDSPILVENLLP